MPHDPPDYKKIERDLWRENAGRVSQRLLDGDTNLLQRIATFVWRFGYDAEEVRARITSDTMFAAHFTKEPNRTGFHERVAAEWLCRLSGVESFKILPKNGKDAFYVNGDGDVLKNMTYKPSKSLDFRWNTGLYTVHAAHKYTKESGGHQDNQFKEVQNLLKNFQKGNADAHTALLVIADGPYYTGQRMGELRRFRRADPPYSGAMSIGDVPAWLDRLPSA